MTTFAVSGEQVAEGNNLSNEISSIGSLRKKKLLVLDLNGLLADIVFPPPCHAKADTIIERKA
ncbi:NLI interacting factor-like phosphatase, partial [Trifolium medium]|nr:NLI interacting factor-like phosphatase [Trifolium medium]